MACYASTLIKMAQNEIGYCEKKTNDQLYDKTANAGHRNYTKYAYEFDTKWPRWYNGKKNGYDWCDVFCDWLFVTAFGYDNALKLTGQPERSLGAGVPWSAQYYKKAGRWHDDDPQVGDQIFFGYSSGSWDHTGIVEAVSDVTVTTIEGNAGDKVCRKSYTKNDSRILGYGRPPYDKEPAQQENSSTAVYTVKRGDTLSRIAAQYATTYQALAEYNGIADPNVIFVGQQIKIPQSGTTVPVYYTVVPGDSMWRIARKYGTTLSNLKKLNPDIRDMALIFPGQKVRVA